MKKLSIVGWYKNKLQDAPNWLRFNIGLIASILGFFLVTRPFSSLTVLFILLGISLIIEGTQRISAAQSQLERFIGIAFILVAIIIAVWPGLSIGVFTLLVGWLLIADGLGKIWSVLRDNQNGKFVAVLVAISHIILGYLTITWPDISTIIIALVFGIRTLWFGISSISQVLRNEFSTAKTVKTKNSTAFYTVIRTGGALLLLLVSFGLLYFSNSIQSKNASVAAFYTVDRDVPQEPGKIIKIEEYTNAVPANARGWRIIYTTTRDDNTPAVSSAFVMTAKEPKLKPQPVLAWTHGTTGYAQQCAPTNLPEPFPLDEVTPDLPAAIDAGYIVVGTDYMGLGTEGPHPYLIGEPVGRAALDSIRALREIPELSVDNKNFVWGHSQGGGAALWTGQVAEKYAPEINLLGIIAAAPASDVPALLDRSKDSPVGKILGAFTVTAYSNIYPDVSFDEYVKPSIQPIVREMAKRCFSEAETLVSILTSLVVKGSIYDRDPLTGPFGERLHENIPLKTIDVPVLVAQGSTDVLVFPDIQESYVADRCDAGQLIEYRLYEGLDHVGVVAEGSPFRADALTWTNDRLAGKTTTSSCGNFN